MLLTMMKAKLHRATVTQADLEYERSISIDQDLLDASGILPHQQLDVLNINNGQLDASEARNYAPNVVLLDEGNPVKAHCGA